MDTPRHYPKAPITEAIIEIRVALTKNTKVEQLEACWTGEQEAYPNKKHFSIATGQFKLGESVATSASSTHVGFRFVSSDGKQVVLMHLGGFAVTRLAPYKSWEPFRDEARRLWDVYREVAKPLEVHRLAVRYVNRLDLPLPVLDLKEYLRTAPDISSDLPQSLAGYFMQLNIPQPEIASTLLLSQTIVEPAQPEKVSIVLDIDLFRDKDVAKDEEEIWRFFEELHVYKNRVFEACITDPTRELFT